mmetsp:Transcript_18322/g.56200  ORF Transcript_18322/g.56200 Transcript_18322/m.56200 type:complete len:80 (-) Transcript_18322:725-964(-)
MRRVGGTTYQMKEEKKKVRSLGSSMRRREEMGYKKEGREATPQRARLSVASWVVGEGGGERRPTGEQDTDEREGRTSRS